jgi:uncharacterized repeat protein (TIGR01451 family)
MDGSISGYACNQNCRLVQNSDGGGGQNSSTGGGGSIPFYLLQSLNNNSGTGTSTGTPSSTPETPKVLGEKGEAKIQMTKKASVEFANPGDKNIEYRIKITNVGKLTVFGATLTDVLPDGFLFADSGKNSKTWQMGDIKAGATKDVVYFVDISSKAEPKRYTNTATLTSLNYDPVIARADIEVKPIRVLAATGFELNEFIALILFIVILLASSLVISKKLDQSNQ